MTATDPKQKLQIHKSSSASAKVFLMFLLTRIAITLITLLAISPIDVLAESDDEPNFRNVRWYDHIDTVKKRETAKFLEYRDHEMNVAVNPPKPWKTEHLYYRDSLLGQPVRILYRFDIDCKLLVRADYIFNLVLPTSEVYVLIDAIQEKYGVELSISVRNGISANGKLDDETTVQIIQRGLLHHHTNNTVVYYQTANFFWFDGFDEGTEPTCTGKEEADQDLRDKL